WIRAPSQLPSAPERGKFGLGGGGSPTELLALRRALSRALRSNGGRPALKGAGRRQKIPMTDSDWNELEGLARSLSETGHAAKKPKTKHRSPASRRAKRGSR